MKKNSSQTKYSLKKLFQREDKLFWIRWGFIVSAICTPLYLFPPMKWRSTPESFYVGDLTSGIVRYILIPLIFILAALGMFELLTRGYLALLNKYFPAKLTTSKIFQFFLGIVSWIVPLILGMAVYLFVVVLFGRVLFG